MHKNPLISNDYKYYERCVDRFKQHQKYFNVYIYYDKNINNNNIIEKFNKINNKLSVFKYVIMIEIVYINMNDNIQIINIVKNFKKIILYLNKSILNYNNNIIISLHTNKYIMNFLSDYFNNYKFLETTNELKKTNINQKIYNILKSSTK